MRKLIGAALVIAWVAYVATTASVAWRIVTGDTPSFLKNYTLGTNAGWVMLGVMLWVATEWFREFRDRS
jgi:apolipoprotein N-acyltransferase